MSAVMFSKATIIAMMTFILGKHKPHLNTHYFMSYPGLTG